MSRYWKQPKYYFCDNCRTRYNAVGTRLNNEQPFQCTLCGFDAYPVWEDGDQHSKRNSHTGWQQPTRATCDNCNKTYSTVGTSGEPFKCVHCLATVFPRFN